MPDRITRVRLTHLQIPFKEPFRISSGEVAVKDAILVQVEDDQGRVGLGESSPMAAGFGYSADTPEQCWRELRQTIAPRLLGPSSADADAIAGLASGWGACSRFAVAGAETACWDLMAQSRHLILAEALGASGDAIERGVGSGLAVGLYPTVVELLRTIENHLEEGYQRVKIKIAPGQDVELVRAVRRQFGDLDLMVDANAAYTTEHLDVLRSLDEFDLLMIEQPMAADDLNGLAALQSSIETPVCIDESADTPERTALAVDRGACRIVNIKLQRVGGFGPALEILELCRRRDVACWVGTMPELGIGQAHGLHLAVMPNIRYPTDIEPSARWFVDDYVEPAIELGEDHLFRNPLRPGLGFLVNPTKLARYQVAAEEFTA